MRILIIEDDIKIANSLKKGLEQERYSIDIAHDGEEGYGIASGGEFDTIILDLMLPSMSGEEICKALREDKISTPILMLTAKDTVNNKVTGLNLGADDYMTKPFDFEELLARIKALLRRPKPLISDVLKCENLTLDTNTHIVTRNQIQISLSKKEYELLEYMMRNKNRVLTKEQIIENVWNFDADILENTVEVYIGYLRNKIDKPFKDEKLIQTIRGFGYLLKEPEIKKGHK